MKRSRYNDDIKIQNSRIKSLHPDLFDSESTNVFTVEDPALKDPEIDKILNDNKRKAEELCEQVIKKCFLRLKINFKNEIKELSLL